MRHTWQATRTCTIDLGYEQLLILTDGVSGEARTQFRGEWLGVVASDERMEAHADKRPRVATMAAKGSLVDAVHRAIVRDERTRPLATCSCMAASPA